MSNYNLTTLHLIIIFTSLILSFNKNVIAQQCNNDYVISNNNESLFTISASNKSCICNSFIGDGSKLNNLENNQIITNLLQTILILQNRIENLTLQISTIQNPIIAKYKTNSGQSIQSGSYFIINFDIKEFDIYNTVTSGTNWRFIAPITGKYLVSTYIMFSSYNSDSNLDLSIFKNSIAYNSLSNKNGLSTYSNRDLSGVTIIDLNAQDYINIQVFQTSGSNKTLYSNSNFNYVVITKISN
jgi:hypothetical protein